jgi:hypothetical protein
MVNAARAGESPANYDEYGDRQFALYEFALALMAYIRSSEDVLFA